MRLKEFAQGALLEMLFSRKCVTSKSCSVCRQLQVSYNPSTERLRMVVQHNGDHLLNSLGK
jgi:hypothetical protein